MRSSPLPVLFGLVCLLAACGGSGGGGAVGGLPSPPAATTPVLGPLQDQTLSGQTVTVTVTATDPQARPLTFLWTCAGGPAAPLLASPESSHCPITFPVAGTYVVAVTVRNPAGQSARREARFTVTDAASFAIEGHAASDGPASGVRADLVWNPSGSVILSGQSDAAGIFSFAGLLGSPDDFHLRIPGR